MSGKARSFERARTPAGCSTGRFPKTPASTRTPRRGEAPLLGHHAAVLSRESKEPALADRLFGITLGERSAGELELVPLLVAENRLDPVLDGLGVDAEAEVLAAAPGVQAERRDRDDDVGVGRIEDRTT